MPVFEYVALNPGGKQIKGTIEADSVRGARQRLRTQNIFPTDIKEGAAATKTVSRDVKQFFKSDRIKLGDLAIGTRQLATLVGAGLPLVNALLALSDQTDTEVFKRIVIQVKEKVEEGSSLAKALAACPRSFPRLYINMVASGEESGTLDTVLENLADYLESQIELRRRISSALFYPILMFCFCSLVVIGLLTFVVPNIVAIFQKQGAVLPLPTRIMLSVSHGFVHFWPLFLAVIAGFVFFVRWYSKEEKGRENLDRILLRLPVYSSLYIKICTARVSRTLGTLLSSGVGLLMAIDISKNIVGNVHVARALEAAGDGVREGRSLAAELNKSGIFPSMLSHMVAVGEKSGKLESMLSKAGKAYENEVNATLSGLTSLIEPVMIIVLGGIVFAIVISVMLPMVNLIDIVQK